MVAFDHSSLWEFENIGKFLRVLYNTPWRQLYVNYFENCYWYHPPLPHGYVGYRENSIDYIFGILKNYFPPILLSFQNIRVFWSSLL
jgi:hypothetical protein